MAVPFHTWEMAKEFMNTTIDMDSDLEKAGRSLVGIQGCNLLVVESLEDGFSKVGCCYGSSSGDQGEGSF
jgi:hypothetical protein